MLITNLYLKINKFFNTFYSSSLAYSERILATWFSLFFLQLTRICTFSKDCSTPCLMCEKISLFSGLLINSSSCRKNVIQIEQAAKYKETRENV